jgi:predicted nucleic acid-binding Zn ribbon protein
MPRYMFECERCSSHFEIECRMAEIIELKPKCTECKKSDKVFRDFSGTHVSVPKTLGSRADKNSSKMSSDHKHHLTEKHNEYRSKKFEGKLPAGAKIE